MLKKAWEILSRWSEAAEDNDEVDAYLYDVSMSAVASLCEFINNYEGEQGNGSLVHARANRAP